MENSTTRRGLLTSAAVIAAAGTWGVASRLFGLSKEKGVMQSEQTVSNPSQRALERVINARSQHWVGDGFLVKSVISPDGDPRVQSPFLLIDHAARRTFEPTTGRRGVGEHPHRGFETVTFAYAGEIEHRDSSGGGGIIGSGDVQWMTAGAGLVHEEFHSSRFSETGGEMEMVQLWVNLPARSKMVKPGYQSLLNSQFPRVSLGAAEARVIAGALNGAKGPAHTHTPITIFDMQFSRAGNVEFSLPSDHHVFTFTLEGEVKTADGALLPVGSLAKWKSGANAGEQVRLHGAERARVLVLSGEPINEPVASYGPFVMNTREQIMEAVRDYQSGKMGHLR